MIDTVILRIHGVKKYRGLIKVLDPLDSEGYVTKEAKVDGKEVDKLRKMGVENQGEILSIMQMQRTGEFLIKSKVGKHQNASNHYNFSYYVNYTLNYIELNFSIPKFVYGSNIVMFVEHIGDRGFVVGPCSEIEHNIEQAYDRLEAFLIHLFRRELGPMEFDRRDVEVHRIDVCFNQVFRSSYDALKYLEYQKRQRKKYSREEEGVMRDYATSLMYVTKRYSAKIYHKGTEYEKNDLKEHLRINKEKGRQYFRTEEYKAFADRILRYELTIRNGMINYLHKKHLFRRKDPMWKLYFDKYTEVEATLQRNDRISKKIGTLPDEEKAAYRKLHPYGKIEKEDRKIHKWIQKTINQRTFFVMGLDEEAIEYNKKMVNYPCNKALFSKGLLKQCLYKLVDFMKEYQIKELPAEDMVARKIDSYNFNHKKQLPKSEMVQFYRELLRLGSFKDTGKFNHVSRATLYRYKQRFKKIGITESSLIPLTEDGIPQAEINLRDYHTEHMFNRYFLDKKGFIEMF